ncbi:MAG: ribosome biogenesis GTPase YlqF [Clostridia bacterium]|nr:ribosome biogenesis GTPase YlqF [Clostridia bacterium]
MHENKTNINWFPGHMAKARRQITESLKQVDLVVEVLDARAPLSSRNPEIKNLISQKPHIVILNKSDLADKKMTEKWVKFYNDNGIPCILFSIKEKSHVNILKNKIKSVMQEKIDHWKSRGMIGRNIKFMLVGIPNVGKSAIINRLVGNSKAKVENKPGVTRRNQWFSVGTDLQILDTPGILWPKFDDQKTALNLAFLGSIKDQILDVEELATEFIGTVKQNYIGNICDRFKMNHEEFKNLSDRECLSLIAKKRGMVVRGGETDNLRCAKMLIEEFRSGKLGKITLESADGEET